MSRRSFTLVELLVTLALVAMLAGFLGKGLVSSLGTFRFQNQVKQLSTHLRKAKILAMTRQTDLSVHLYEIQGTYYFKVELDVPIKGIERRAVALPALTKIALDHKEKNELILKIFSTGRMEPTGELELYHKGDVRTLRVE